MAMGILLLPASRIGADGEGRVLLRGGSFLMGTDEADISKLKESYGINFPSAFENELPVHRVTVGDFRMDRTEVTNERFAAFLAENSDWLPDRLPIERHNGNYLQDWRDNRPPRGREDHPVVAITWQAALAFCHWSGGTLPTEAQWEYAARCGDDREFPWGEALPSPDLANFHPSGHGTTVAAGSYPPNDCGLQDLAGSVWEFLYDAWEPTYPSEAQIDPCIDCPMSDGEMLSVEGRRAVRGGSFDGAVVNLRTRWRDSHVVTNAISFVGFRCAYSSEVQSRVGM
jgi:formylglycine-generating enzyme required for sulfatase activity